MPGGRNESGETTSVEGEFDERLRQELSSVPTGELPTLAKRDWFSSAEKRAGAERAEASQLSADWLKQEGGRQILGERGEDIVLKTCGASRRHLRTLLIDAESPQALARICSGMDRDVVIYTGRSSRLGRAHGFSGDDTMTVTIRGTAFAADIAESADVALESGAWLWRATCATLTNNNHFDFLFSDLEIESADDGAINVRLPAAEALPPITMPVG